MKAIVFDSSTLISIATNNLLWTLPLLKKKFNGEFYITESVKSEVIDRPLQSKRFKLEAMQILSMVAEGVIKVYKSEELRNKSQKITDLINSIYLANDHYIKIIQKAEVESLILSAMLDCTFAVDERTMRVFVEDYKGLLSIFANKLHIDVKINEKNLNIVRMEVHKVNIIRSVELMTIAYKLGMLNSYLNPEEKNIINIDLKKSLLDGLLWGLRLRGCSVSSDEINEIMALNGLL